MNIYFYSISFSELTEEDREILSADTSMFEIPINYFPPQVVRSVMENSGIFADIPDIVMRAIKKTFKDNKTKPCIMNTFWAIRSEALPIFVLNYFLRWLHGPKGNTEKLFLALYFLEIIRVGFQEPKLSYEDLLEKYPYNKIL